MARMFNIDPRQHAQRQYEVLIAKYYVERIETLGSSIESICHGATGGFIPRLKQVIERPGDKWRQHLAGHLRGLLGAVGARVVKEANSSSVTAKNWPETLGEEGRNACIFMDQHLAKFGNEGEPSFDILMKLLSYMAVIMEEVECHELGFHRSAHRDPQRPNRVVPNKPGKGPRDPKKGPKDPNKPRKNLKTELCRQVKDGVCSYGQKCKYAHSEAERQAALAGSKAKPTEASPKREAAPAPPAEPAPAAGLPVAVPQAAGLSGLPGLPQVPATVAVPAPSLNLPGLPYGLPQLPPASLPLGPVQPLQIPVSQPLQLPQAMPLK